MNWVVELLDATVADELNALPADMRARFRRIVELIQSNGLQHVHEPHIKYLEDRLWQMRLQGRDGIARAIYVTAPGRRAVIVRVFIKKTERTPRREIEIALERARRVR